jgi:hypothetical protein
MSGFVFSNDHWLPRRSSSDSYHVTLQTLGSFFRIPVFMLIILIMRFVVLMAPRIDLPSTLGSFFQTWGNWYLSAECTVPNFGPWDLFDALFRRGSKAHLGTVLHLRHSNRVG